MQDMTDDTWLTPLLSKRTPLAIRVLMDLCEAGLKKGWCYAGDVSQTVDKAASNTIGGVFKILPRFGFAHTDERIKMPQNRKHGRKVDKWVLSERWKAEAFIKHQRNIITKTDAAGHPLLNL